MFIVHILCTNFHFALHTSYTSAPHIYISHGEIIDAEWQYSSQDMITAYGKYFYDIELEN